MCTALKNDGHEVDLIVIERTQWDKINRIFGFTKNTIHHETILPPYKYLPTIYARFVNWFFRDALALNFLKSKYDITIVTMPTVPFVDADMLYVHFPDFISANLELYFSGRYTGVFRPYAELNNILNSLFVTIFKKIKNRSLIVTNSKFSRGFIRTYLSVNAIILYPPVNVQKYLCLSNNERKENIVLTISRLELVKNLEIIPVMAHYLKNTDVHFVIIGSTSSNSSNYLTNILNKAKTLGVENKITIIQNADENIKIEMLSKAKVYLHTMKFEHFGISIVEAMSAGLVPVVHKSGGPWIDILNETQGVYGFSYRDPYEASQIIVKLIKNEEFCAELSKKAIEKSLEFTSGIFKSNLCTLVKKYYQQKKRLR